MKKTKLNLLTNRVDYQRLETIFRWIRISSLGLSIIVIITIGGFFLVFSVQSSKIQDLLNQKTTYLSNLKDRENEEAKLYYIQTKDQQLNSYLSQDAHSLPYYNLLNTALSKSSESATLKSFLMQKNRETNFTVTFINFDELLNFFRFIESDDFLKKFEKVSLKSFTAIGDNKAKTNYELSFIGKFIEIHETSY